ncbi:MAG: hypothetical protein IJ225_10050 [Solobacterium sp.]|nr:hypothetical protein [Solobacterium sp.]
MNEELRASLEEAAVKGYTLSQVPKWHFLFLENTEMLSSLKELCGEKCSYDSGIAVFGSKRDWPSCIDACSALNRMAEVSSGVLSEAMRKWMLREEAGELLEALGVPEGYVCLGVLLIDVQEEHPLPSRKIRWNVFSYMK